MKNIIVALFAFATLNAFAGTSYYAARYEITGTEPLCPVNAMCVTNGTIVHLAATLENCLDKVIASEIKVDRAGDEKAVILALGVVKTTTKSLKVNCFVPAVDRRTVTLENFYSDDIELINAELENR